jgi:photosystem II stability/assembly factor-like uncharacterized protein
MKFKLTIALFSIFVLTFSSCQKDEDTCGNGVQDGIEVGVDCGGDCALCDGLADHCFNGYMDDDETGVDCGGSCAACPPAFDPFPSEMVYTFPEDIIIVKFFDEFIGYVATKTSISSTLYKTTDGGAAWSVIPTPISDYIQDIEFGSTADKVFICDHDGGAFRSYDGGTTWTTITVGGSMGNATNIEIVSDNIWLWNDHLSSIYYTTDAGVTYASATINGSTNLDATDLYTFYPGGIGYTFMRDGGNGDIYYYETVNSGLTWDLVVQTMFSQTPYTTHYESEDEVYAIVYTDLIKTIDGGQTWSIASTDCASEMIYMYNGKGLVMSWIPQYSNDNGATWTKYTEEDGSDFVLLMGSSTYGLQVFQRDNIVYFTSHDNHSLLTYDMNNIN